MKSSLQPDSSFAPWRQRLYHIIFEADTRAGKVFDVALLVLILFSVFVICWETVVEKDGVVDPEYRRWFLGIEWAITILFTLEYVARIISVRHPFRYIFSFFGIVDLLAILPTYVAALLSGAGSSLVVLRAIRLLRVFRVLKLVWLVSGS